MHLLYLSNYSNITLAITELFKFDFFVKVIQEFN